jgi:ring-1,2-phenylacetyl-CoA epoxidase subunit PaaE
MRFHPLPVIDLHPETDDTVSVSFGIPDELSGEFDFTQGQHLTLRREFNQEEVRRSYSICTSVFENDLRIAVKSIPKGLFSGFIHQTLAVGDVIDVGSPIGHFNVPLNQDNRKRYAAFAAGSGITPVIYIIKTTLAVEPHSAFTLVYGNRETRSIIFREELEALKNSYLDRLSIVHALSRESRNIPLLDGRIDRPKVDLLLGSILIPQHYDEFFICGPKDMIDGVQDALLAKEVDKSKIHFELFTAPGQAFARSSRRARTGTPPSGLSTVTVFLEGKSTELTMEPDDDTILEAIRRVRPEVPYACKSGVCATCRAKLLDGQVDTYLDFALEEHERKAGYILTCQSKPASEHIVLDFDAL